MNKNNLLVNEIVEGVLTNLHDGKIILPFRVIVPEFFSICLNSQDYHDLKEINGEIITDIKRALSEEVILLNRASQIYQGGPVWRFLYYLFKQVSEKGALFFGKSVSEKKEPPLYLEPERGWQIKFIEDIENKCGAGEVRIISRMRSPKKADLEGSNTLRITTTHLNSERKFTSEHHEEIGTTAGAKTPYLSPQVVPEPPEAYGVIEFQHEHNQQTFRLTKNEIVIGRGGINHWVDLMIDGHSTISREHLRIRRDPQTGKIYAIDLSSHGVKVNDRAMPKGFDIVDGHQRENNKQVELPRIAEIILADTVVLQFKVLDN